MSLTVLAHCMLKRLIRSCLALVPVPVTAKLDINVLIADPENKQFIVKWNWGMVAVMALGTGNGIARLTIE